MDGTPKAKKHKKDKLLAEREEFVKTRKRNTKRGNVG